MSIYLTPEYPRIWNCRGSGPLEIHGATTQELEASGRIVYAFGVPIKTIVGGMAGDGIAHFNKDVIRMVLRRCRGMVEVYSLHRQPVLLEFGFSEQRMFTFMVDLSDIEGLWWKIDKKNRTAIRRAREASVRMQELRTLVEFRGFYGLFIQQRRRWNYEGPGMDYFENVWRLLVQKGKAAFFAALLEGKTLSVAEILFHGSDMMMPQWGTAQGANMARGANNYLIWSILEWGNAHGFKRFNFWGAEEGPNTRGPHRGIYEFKQSFGSRLLPIYKYEKANRVLRALVSIGKIGLSLT
jgi:lipid II:glycine glycyltransferase (peptidoglycan interpeptide bridge formation enzyme)